MAAGTVGDLKVPRRAIAVDIALKGHAVRHVKVFLPGLQSPRLEVVDLLAHEREFIPALDVGDGTWFLFSKKNVVWIAVPDSTPEAPRSADQDEEWFDRRHHVRIELSNGETLSGMLLYSAPAESARVLDHLNLPDRFFRLFRDDSIYLVNKAFVCRLVDFDPEWGKPRSD